jgi:hypothetical protein
MRAALYGAGWAAVALGLAGLVITVAALGRNRGDDGDGWDALIAPLAGEMSLYTIALGEGAA